MTVRASARQTRSRPPARICIRPDHPATLTTVPVAAHAASEVRAWPRAATAATAASSARRAGRSPRCGDCCVARPRKGSRSDRAVCLETCSWGTFRATNMVGGQGKAPATRDGEGRQVSKRFASAAAIAAAFALVPATAASAQDNDGSPNDPRAKAFVKEVSVDRVERHQQRLQEIADANEGTRVVFGGGYTDSVDYVVRVLERAGYEPEITPFNYPLGGVRSLRSSTRSRRRPRRTGPARRRQTIRRTSTSSRSRARRRVARQRAGGARGWDQIRPAPGRRRRAAARPRITRPPSAAPSRWCSAGRVRVQKWELAQEAGAVGIIIFNEGNTPTAERAVRRHPASTADHPGVLPARLGKELYNAYQAGQNPTWTCRRYGVSARPLLRPGDRRDRRRRPEQRRGRRRASRLRRGRPGHQRRRQRHRAAAHDGPAARPSGPSARQKIRFGWWGGEEEGLIGSNYYADEPEDEEVSKIDVMLDYDMLSSPNYARLRLRRRRLGGGNPAGPEGSGTVEEVFREWFSSKRQPVWRDPVRRPLGLRRLHGPRHPGRRRLRRGGGRQDREPGAAARRRRRVLV